VTPHPVLPSARLPNVRHLETFYHVVSHRGICRAAGKPPHCIQQPAISEQIQALEQDIGHKLFDRQPFRLTQEGRQLYAIVARFFEELQTALPGLRGGLQTCVRIGADDLLIRHYLPEIVRPMAEAEGLRFTFQSASAMEMIEWLQAGKIDLVIAPTAGRVPPGLASVAIVERPLVLIVAKSSEIDSADQFWANGRVAPPLVCPGPQDGVSQVFRRGLKRGGLHWPVQIEAPSVASVAAFVAGGTSVGVSLDLACLLDRPDVRALPLRGFDPVSVCGVWRRPDTSRLKPLIRRIRHAARTW
jgi:DNA-binding transcriptional LysR family regulator